jgi:predicted ABC-type ATPase
VSSIALFLVEMTRKRVHLIVKIRIIYSIEEKDKATNKRGLHIFIPDHQSQGSSDKPGIRVPKVQRSDNYLPKLRNHMSSMDIIVVVGPKGSGKTTIGTWIAQDLEGGTFLEVEMIAKEIIASGESWTKEHTQLLYDEIFNQVGRIAASTSTSWKESSSSPCPFLVYETTGAAQSETQNLLDRLEEAGHTLHMVRVRASTVTCGLRINGRDASRQVTCSQEMIENIHQLTEALEWPWHLELDNDGDGISRKDIVEHISRLVASI